MNLGRWGYVYVEASESEEMKETATSWMDFELPLLFCGIIDGFLLALLKKNDCGQPILIRVLSGLVWSPFSGWPIPLSFLFHLLPGHITLPLFPFLFPFVSHLKSNHLFLYGLNMVFSVPWSFALVWKWMWKRYYNLDLVILHSQILAP